jgi:ribosomal protein L4
MSKPFNSRRHFAIRAMIAKKAANDNIVVGGRTIAVTDDNRQLVEFIRDIDAERAFEDAAFGREPRARIAA